MLMPACILHGDSDEVATMHLDSTTEAGSGVGHHIVLGIRTAHNNITMKLNHHSNYNPGESVWSLDICSQFLIQQK